MLTNPQELITEFELACNMYGARCPPIRHELVLAPHQRPNVKLSKLAVVYVFSLSDRYGDQVPAGRGRVLKVGHTTQWQRYAHQHYNGHALSTLRGAIASSWVLWPFLGITEFNSKTGENWIREHTDRDHFFIDSDDASYFLYPLELFIRGRVGSVFEGSALCPNPPRTLMGESIPDRRAR